MKLRLKQNQVEGENQEVMKRQMKTETEFHLDWMYLFYLPVDSNISWTVGVTKKCI